MTQQLGALLTSLNIARGLAGWSAALPRVRRKVLSRHSCGYALADWVLICAPCRIPLATEIRL
jgi:hypothetical protein